MADALRSSWINPNRNDNGIKVRVTELCLEFPSNACIFHMCGGVSNHRRAEKHITLRELPFDLLLKINEHRTSGRGRIETGRDNVLSSL